MSELFTNVKCPYCGNIQRVKVDINDAEYSKRIKLCYPDDGGCNEYFAVFFSLIIQSDALKIEGFGGVA
jgi:hypothetical protein